MQGSIISPALFNIFCESLIEDLVIQLGIENVFAYADDLATVSEDIDSLRISTQKIEKWSADNKIPINYNKSGILNIILTTRSQRMITGDSFMQFPIKPHYKYLGAWLNETTHPLFHLDEIKKKVNFLEHKLRIIPRKTSNPAFIMNLWAVFIRPLFDYGSILCTISGKKLAEGTLLKRINGIFKRTAGLRKNTSNKIVSMCLGYFPLKFAQEKTRLSLEKWQAHKNNDPFPIP